MRARLVRLRSVRRKLQVSLIFLPGARRLRGTFQSHSERVVRGGFLGLQADRFLAMHDGAFEVLAGSEQCRNR